MPHSAPLHRPPGAGPTRDYRQERRHRMTDATQRERLKLSSSGCWQKARDFFLQHHVLCADPYGVHGVRPVVAVEVDHIVPLVERPDLLTEPANLQAICGPCHRRKSGLERSRARR